MRVLHYVLAALMLMGLGGHACAHDIYSHVFGKGGQLCCGGDPVTGDCAPVIAQIEGDYVVYFIHPGRIRQSYKEMPDVRVRVPISFVTFLPIAGQEQQEDVPMPGPGQAIGHFCGRPATFTAANVFDGWLVYCAFLDPGAT